MGIGPNPQFPIPKINYFYIFYQIKIISLINEIILIINNYFYCFFSVIILSKYSLRPGIIKLKCTPTLCTGESI